MPKAYNPKLAIHLNLLKPQSSPEKFVVKLLRWLLYTGRYLFVFVEAIVLIAFVARFKLDGDLAAKKEAIEEQIPYIESLKPYEILIRQTQLKLSTIATVKKEALDFSIILKKIADQTPLNVKLTAINIEKEVDNADIRINGQTQVSSDLTSFMAGLKEEESFSNVNITNIGLEQGIITFSIEAAAKLASVGGKL